MEGIKIDTVIHGESVELDPPDEDGDVRMVVTERIVMELIGVADCVSAAVYLNREQRRQLAHALLKLDET